MDLLNRNELEQLFARADANDASPAHNVSVPMPLLDLYIIWKEKGTLDGLRVALLGNLKSNERAQTLARLLGRFDVRLSFVSPAALSMPYDISEELRAANLEVEETNDLPTTLAKSDVLYLVRLDPKLIEPKIFARYKDFYTLTPTTTAVAKPGLLVLGEWEGAELLLEHARAHATQYEGALKAALPD
ncbi:MAG: hypothetical protein WCF84_02535 [Anaerolineae bacterium]